MEPLFFLTFTAGSAHQQNFEVRRRVEPCGAHRHRASGHSFLARGRRSSEASERALLSLDAARTYIIPVFVGEYMTVEGVQVLRKFADFGEGTYADTVEGVT